MIAKFNYLMMYIQDMGMHNFGFCPGIGDRDQSWECRNLNSDWWPSESSSSSPHTGFMKGLTSIIISYSVYISIGIQN